MSILYHRLQPLRQLQNGLLVIIVGTSAGCGQSSPKWSRQHVEAALRGCRLMFDQTMKVHSFSEDEKAVVATLSSVRGFGIEADVKMECQQADSASVRKLIQAHVRDRRIGPPTEEAVRRKYMSDGHLFREVFYFAVEGQYAYITKLTKADK